LVQKAAVGHRADARRHEKFLSSKADPTRFHRHHVSQRWFGLDHASQEKSLLLRGLGFDRQRISVYPV